MVMHRLAHGWAKSGQVITARIGQVKQLPSPEPPGQRSTLKQEVGVLAEHKRFSPGRQTAGRFLICIVES